MYNLAKPVKARAAGDTAAAQTRQDSMQQSDQYSESSRTATNPAALWEPRLSQMQAFGIVKSDKVAWPTPAHLQKLDLGKVMKLKSIDLGFTQSLYEIRLNFTNGAKSTSLKTGFAPPLMN